MTQLELALKLRDPLRFAKYLWPDVEFYREQRQIIYSVLYNDETYVPAGNELGKDYVAGFIALYFFLTRHPCRIVTTSAKDDHLRVLWGEINRFVQTSRIPLDARQGGPLILNHQDMRKVVGADPSTGKPGVRCPMSYCTGLVASPDSIAAMQGHHVTEVGSGVSFQCCGETINTPMPRNLFMSDESSSVADGYYKMATTWAKRMLIFGNTWPCTNFFYRGVKAGDLKAGSDQVGKAPGVVDSRLPVEGMGGRYAVRAPQELISSTESAPVVETSPLPHDRSPLVDQGREGRELLGEVAPLQERFYRKVIKIRAVDSPNVRLALEEIKRGLPPSGRMVVPGVKNYEVYKKNLLTWDKIQQCVSLGAEFYEGAELRLFPKEWLDRAEELGRKLSIVGRKARAIGIDPAEGGDKTAQAAVDMLGLLELQSKKTPDTSIITSEALAFMRYWQVEPENVVFDRGGGGKEHADRLRQMGYPVRTVAFGESLLLEPRRGLTIFPERKENREERYAYRNRRSEMYGTLRQLLDPALNPQGFAIPPEYMELLRPQLEPIPLQYDGEGRLDLPPKNRRAGQEETNRKTLVELIGHSPDEADALVIAIYGMLNKSHEVRAGGF